jgi:hypothetical protein
MNLGRILGGLRRRKLRPVVLASVGILTGGLLATIPASPALAATACQASYSQAWAGGSGFGGSIVITNLGDPLTSWTLTFTFPRTDIRVGNGWNGQWSQATAPDTTVTVRNESWNGNVAANGTVNPQFNGTFNGTPASGPPAPTGFAINGVPCTGPNQAPIVGITSPTQNQRFTAPANIPIAATASDPDAGDTIARVEFYHDGVLLGSDTTAPYSFTWTGVPTQATAYHVQARSFDNRGAGSLLADVPVFVDPFVGPSVQVSAPAVTVNEGGTATFGVRLSQAPTANTTVTVARTAGDTDISVSAGATLTFTPANFGTAQNVTLAAAEDTDTTNGTATITASATGFTAATVSAMESDNDVSQYIQRFNAQYDSIHNPANGYFSPEGIPYHAVETLIVEAPDWGHETTSEAFSFWLWLEAEHGRVSSDWAPFNQAWQTMETFIIPSPAAQPLQGNYNPNDPADFAPERAEPSQYPVPLDTAVVAGQDPLAGELQTTYGDRNVYGMHWLLDVDNTYGYGNGRSASLTECGDSTPRVTYINTYQRGAQESVWETIAHPSCETGRFGAAGTGYPSLFIQGSGANQWRYTDAPDADARAVQAAYWALVWATQQNQASAVAATVAKAAKMGDFLRYSFFDKYFKNPGCAASNCTPGTGKSSSSYLLSWYYAWGGDIAGAWSWRIGSSASHQGYQNPLAAWALSTAGPAALHPRSPTASGDWATSLTRQLQFYQWLQSADGAIAGGATNNVDGTYGGRTAGTPNFFGLQYDVQPVFHDPPSNQWFGFQAWSLERVAEYYFVTNDARAKSILDKWVPWAIGQTTFLNNDFQIPSDMAWQGAPSGSFSDAAGTPAANPSLRVTVTTKGNDIGVAAAYARLLTYYAAKSGNTAARTTAKQLLDAIWTHRDAPVNGVVKGVSVPEQRKDYNRFDDANSDANQVGLFVPPGFSGTMPNGDQIAPGKTFLDIRSFYKNDPAWPSVAAYLADQNNPNAAPTFSYHRFWAQADIAMAMADYGNLFGS